VAKRHPRTLAEVAAVNLLQEYGSGTVGRLKATKKAAEAVSVLALAIAAERGAAADGGWPTQAEYAVYCKRAFPGEDGPERLATAMHANYRARLAENVSCAFSIPADAVAVGV
jgi:hypothetical protein